MVTRLLALLVCVCVVALPPDEMPTLVPSPAPEAPAEQQAVAPAAAPTSLPKLSVPLPIINLGMPKSGSSSLYDFFKCGGFNSAHLLCNDGMGSGSCPANAAGTCRCGSCMHENLVAGRPIFEGCGNYDVWAQMDLDGYPVWTDTNGEQQNGLCFMPQVTALDAIHAQFPNATFTLPVRSPANWIHSVSNWDGGGTGTVGAEGDMRKRLASCGFPDLPKDWTDEQGAAFYEGHTQAVRDFVKAHPSHTLLEFDLEEDIQAQGIKMAAAFGGVHESCYGKSNCFKSCDEKEEIERQKKKTAATREEKRVRQMAKAAFMLNM
jgi:hypothetical protein